MDKEKRVIRPDAASCVACHDEDYRALFEEWRTTIGRLLTEVRAGLHEIYKEPLAEAVKAQVQAIERGLQALELDGSRGVHNYAFAEEFLTNAAKTIKSLGAGSVKRDEAPEFRQSLPGGFVRDVAAFLYPVVRYLLRQTGGRRPAEGHGGQGRGAPHSAKSSASGPRSLSSSIPPRASSWPSRPCART
jgi:hypothetical protein